MGPAGGLEGGLEGDVDRLQAAEVIEVGAAGELATDQGVDEAAALGVAVGGARADAQGGGEADSGGADSGGVGRWFVVGRDGEVHRRLTTSVAVAPSATQNWAALMRLDEPMRNLQ